MAVVGGNHIHVDRACPPRKKLKGENASGLPYVGEAITPAGNWLIGRDPEV
ncbi:putative sulfate adenylyltransferase [Helianthus debilis subsp. tardiflorus]